MDIDGLGLRKGLKGRTNVPAVGEHDTHKGFKIQKDLRKDREVAVQNRLENDPILVVEDLEKGLHEGQRLHGELGVPEKKFFSKHCSLFIFPLYSIKYDTLLSFSSIFQC